MSNKLKVKEMKRFRLSLRNVVAVAICLVVSSAFVACGKEPTSVILDQYDVVLDRGKTLTLKAVVLPEDANQNVTWTSSKPDVATVKDGLITAMKDGETVITVTTKRGNLTVTCNVTVGILEIGKPYQGGIIIYLDSTGIHGLIGATVDQSEGICWDPEPDYKKYITVGTGRVVGTGKSNTKKIVEALGAGNYAAKLCDDLVLNGYSDWFLPSYDELMLLANACYYAGVPLDAKKDFWSSSEYSIEGYVNALTIQSTWGRSKGDIFSVRAIRAF